MMSFYSTTSIYIYIIVFHFIHMVVGFTTTYATRVYHNLCCKFESRSGRGVQYYVIKFVSDLRQLGGFLRVLRFSPPIKLTFTI
jgi:hypothetical protein